MTKLAKKFKTWPLFALFTLTLSSCGTTNTSQLEQPLSGSICETQAALVNPNRNGRGSGIGGTGVRVAQNGNHGGGEGGEGGIGGTGIVAGASKSAFGSGGVGGTGIVGVITGFASICVNGVEVNYDATTPVWENGKPSAISQLAVGQVVSVTAVNNGQQLMARGIGVIQAVVGPISTVNPATGELRVMGQKINAAQINLSQLKVGDWVRLSGQSLATGEVVASYIEAMPMQANMQAQVRGIAQNAQGKTVMVGDTRVNLSTAAPSATFINGDELWISGIWNGRLLQAKEIAINPTVEGLGRVEKIVFEGFIHSSNSRNLSLGSQTLVLSDHTQIVGGSSRELVVNRRVRVSGHLGSDQRIAVDRVEFTRPARSQRSGKSTSSNDDNSRKRDDSKSGKSSDDDSSSGSNSGSGSSGSGSSGSGSGGSNSGSSGSGSSGSGSSGSSSGSGSSGSGSSGSGSGSTSSSSGKGSSGSGKSSSK